MAEISLKAFYSVMKSANCRNTLRRAFGRNLLGRGLSHRYPTDWTERRWSAPGSQWRLVGNQPDSQSHGCVPRHRERDVPRATSLRRVIDCAEHSHVTVNRVDFQP